jgi:hypothetical protein
MPGRSPFTLVPAALLAAALLSAFGQGPAKTAGKKYAVLVGVNRYEHPKLARLKYAENDVSELADVLGKAGYEVVLLTGPAGARKPGCRPTRVNIEARLKEVLRKCRRADTLVLAFAGHGVQFEGKKDAFFCPVDARPFADETTTLVSLSKVYVEMERSFAGVKLLLVDACRDDPRGSRGVGGDTAPRPPSGVGALFSCRAGQRAFEHDTLRHGVFFHFVLEALKGKAKNEDGEVTWDDLATYVKRQVNRQTPKIIGDGARQTPHEIKDLIGEAPVLVRLAAAAGRSSRPKKVDVGEVKREPVRGPAQAVRWLGDNSRINPAGIKGLASKLDATLDEYNGVTLIVGPVLTRSGQAYCLELWAGQFFAFPLSEAQARRLKVEPKKVRYVPRAKGLDRRLTPPPVHLGPVLFDGGERLDGSKPVRGEVLCQVTTPPEQKVALRLSYPVGDTMVSKFYLLDEELTRGKKRVRFSFPALNTDGPLVVFLDLCLSLPRGRTTSGTLLSNTQAALVEVE